MLFADLHPLIAQHGYWAVFLIVLLESAGIPLPGESALLLAGIYAGATGQLDIAWVITSAASGAIIGDNIGFWVGRRWGVQLLQRYGKYVHLTESRQRMGQYLFERHGAKIVFFGRFIAFLRVFAALLAGVNRYGWAPFLFYNALGGVIWAAAMGGAAFFFGDSIHRVSGPLGMAALGAAVIGIVGFVVVVRRHERKMEDRFAAAAAGGHCDPAKAKLDADSLSC